QARFPDWEQVIGRLQSAGQYIRLVTPEGNVARSSCMGTNPGTGTLPEWVSGMGTWLLGAQTEIARPVSYREKSYGTLVVTTDTDVALSAVWRAVSGLLGLSALVVTAICLLQYVAISRALRPTRDILHGLDTLAQGDLSYRLPAFRLIELQRISEVFNTLA